MAILEDLWWNPAVYPIQEFQVVRGYLPSFYVNVVNVPVPLKGVPPSKGFLKMSVYYIKGFSPVVVYPQPVVDVLVSLAV